MLMIIYIEMLTEVFVQGLIDWLLMKYNVMLTMILMKEVNYKLGVKLYL